MPKGVKKTHKVFYFSEAEIEVMQKAVEDYQISVDQAYREDLDYVTEFGEHDLVDPAYWKNNLDVSNSILRKLMKGGRVQ